MRTIYMTHNKRNWEVIIEFSNHSQMRWMDRRVSHKTINTMVDHSIKYFFSNYHDARKRRLVINHLKRKSSLVIAMLKYDRNLARMRLLVITILHKLMYAEHGELVIEIDKQGREKVYENKVKVKPRLVESELVNNESCSGQMSTERDSGGNPEESNRQSPSIHTAECLKGG